MSLYHLENIHFHYMWQNQIVPVLKGISLDIPQGSFTCIVGPSGSGKTTLLNLLGLLDHPQKGVLKLENTVVQALREPELETLRLHKLGFIFQAFYLLPTLTVFENTTYFLSQLGLTPSLIRDRGDHVLQMVGLFEHRNKRPAELSGGQRQRVAIARALAKKPKIILADEPTANLDRKTASDLIQIFQTLKQKEGVSFIFSTHDSHLVSYADRVLSLRDGELLEGELHD